MNQNEYKSISFDEFTDHLGVSECFESIALCGDLELTDNKYRADREYVEYSRLRDAAPFAEDRARYQSLIPKRRPGFRYYLGFEFPVVYTQLELF